MTLFIRWARHTLLSVHTRLLEDLTCIWVVVVTPRFGPATAQSEALLDALWTYPVEHHNVYCHQWRLGDLVLWDNRTTMHRRDSFDASARRIMHRTQIKGSHQPRAFYSEEALALG